MAARRPATQDPGENAVLETARQALAQADWLGAAALFRTASEASPDSAEAWDGLAAAAYWIPDDETMLTARERAFHLYKDRGDDLSAARMAAWLAVDTIEMRGLEAVGNGWIQRAKRLVAGRHNTPDGVWVMGISGRVLSLTGAPTSQVCRTAARTAAMARQLDMSEAEALNLAAEGTARLALGDVARAVPCLDEAAAIVCTGEVRDLTTVALTLCLLMSACERTRDFDRARQWCAVARQFSEDRGFPVVLSICRSHYGAVMIWRGHWDEAEEHLQKGSQELMEFMPPFAVGAISLMAGLRWRQGRWDEAERFFDQVRNEAPAQLGIAELLAGNGELDAAVEVLERHLRELPETDKLERGPTLDILVRCLTMAGDSRRAQPYMQELRKIAASVGTSSLRAAAAVAEGVMATASGQTKVATEFLGDAVSFFERAGAPFESARARILLAQALLADSRPDAAAREALIARETMLRVGAAREAERAERVSAMIESQRTSPLRSPDGLTPREQEILRLLAEGHSNQEIAGGLVLSVRTVERHISNIYEKLGLEGRTARTAAAAHAYRSNAGRSLPSQ